MLPTKFGFGEKGQGKVYGWKTDRRQTGYDHYNSIELKTMYNIKCLSRPINTSHD